MGPQPLSNPGLGAASSRQGSWEDASQRSFPGAPPLSGQPPSATPIPSASRPDASFNPTLSSAHGTAPPHGPGAPIPEPRPSAQGFDPSRAPGASTPVLGSTLTVSPSARDSSVDRAPGAGGQPGGPTKAAVPLAAKVGAAAAGALLTVIVLVFALRSKPPADADVAPGTAGTSTSTAGAAPADSPPAAPATTPAPVEGVIEMPEGDVAEAIAAEPELLEEMDASTGPTGPKIPPIPFGKARLIVVSKSGPCKVTVNGISQGMTPVHIFVNPGKTKVYCRLTTGSTRSRELDVPRMRTTFVIFENPSSPEAPKQK